MEKPESASTCQQNYDTMKSQIEKAVEEMPAEETIEAPEKPVEEPKGAEAPKEPEAPAPKDGGGEAFTVGDAEIERAVKAGLSVADARSFTDKGAFERICSMLEAKNAPGGKEISKDSEEKPKDGDGDSADFDIPDITEDEDFDPKLVKLGAVVRKMGDALKAMREENKSLREAVGKSEEAKREAAKAAKVEERNKTLRLAPPGGVKGARKEKTEDDILAEVAGEISSKFNI